MRLAGLLLAGGLGTRMGEGPPKPLLDLWGRPLAAWALDPLRETAEPIFVGAEDEAAFGALGYPVLKDLQAERRGPAAGLAALSALLDRAFPSVEATVVVPGDTPFLPSDLVDRLLGGWDERRVRLASRGGHLHPTVAIWPRDALRMLRQALEAPDARRSLLFHAERAGVETVEFDDDQLAPQGDPFFNVNTPDDLATARNHRRSPRS